ncbi:hypothetical protein GGR56DRAFT_665418 [Xylariaceae sp. FL0804]|nr:hypothetical protein GGR56DRAFT_665418 [Xylariaceae sp. FL0804]
MFQSFTGASRRSRNVNLSGQRNTNPWAASSWGPNHSGASQTVAHAQAEREKRQRERDELAAARRIQRVWRGYNGRQQVRKRCRRIFDALYESPAPADLQGRARSALPLLLALFDPANPSDQQRLDSFIQDLLSTQPAAITSAGLIDLGPSSLDKFASLAVGALERRPSNSSQTLLGLLVDVVGKRPIAVAPLLDRYYSLLAGYSEDNGQYSSDTGRCQILSKAAAAPLVPIPNNGKATLRAYQAFAYSFLTSPNLRFLQEYPTLVAQRIDLQQLSHAVVNAFVTREQINKVPRDGLLWLLAHFIALNRAVASAQAVSYLEAIYLQLSLLTIDIRVRSDPAEASDEDDMRSQGDDVHMRDLAPLPEYVSSQLNFLVNDDGISELLNKFTTTASSTARLSEDASLLAGYTLVLLRCFPNHSDDIKMRLFQGDISVVGNSPPRLVPSVRYFWKAASQTEVFTTVLRTDVQKRPISVVSLLKPDPSRDPEWRTVLLFLELYNFLLRVTDDEDFLSAASELSSQQSPATRRIRSSGLSLDELKQLVSFLKNLSFPLYYNLPDIMSPEPQPGRFGALMGLSSSRPNAPEETRRSPPSFAGIIGLDVLGLRDATTTTMRSIYERDSRRGFLPKDFWLMTTKFDMDSFVQAVVLEEQQRNEQAEEEDDNDDEDSNGTGGTLDSFHTAAGHRLSRAAQIERHRQMRKTQREQFLSQVGPKLEVLRNMPFAIPFEVRVQIFKKFVYLDKSKRRGGYVDPEQWRFAMMSAVDGAFDPTNNFSRGREALRRHTARVRRGKVFSDALSQFYPLGEAIKEPIQITFLDQFDQPEAGIDGGGVTKEFLTSVTNEAFRPGSDGHNLFVANNQNLLYPNPSAFDECIDLLRTLKFTEGGDEWRECMTNLTRRYEFLGRIVGKCLYEGILIDIAFSGFFLLKWSSSGQSAAADYRASLNDLRDLDPELYQGLVSLKNYPGDVSDLSLDFTITDQFTAPDGQVRTITRPLRKDGENIPLTNKDRPLYIAYVANHRLVAQQYRQTKAFLHGLGAVINPAWLSMFNQTELQRLVGGDSSELDIDDLRANTSYSGLYAVGDDGQDHPTIQLFWQVMRELRDSERRDVIKYVTSTPRAPLLGFSQLHPRFSIRDSGTDEDRLPSTSTCVNLLKLPRYSSAKILKSKLLYAVQSGAGFDLS